MNDIFERILPQGRERKPRPMTKMAELAHFFDESSQTLTNWKNRGVPKDKLIKLARAFGVIAEWLETGEGSKYAQLISDDLTPSDLIEEAARHSGVAIPELLADYILYGKKT